MLDFATEQPIPLAAVCGMYPGRKDRLNFSTVWRWVLRGVKAPGGVRVRLEAARVGGRWLTSHEALNRFTQRLTPRLDGDPPISPRTAKQRRLAAERAGEELANRGA